MSCSGAEADINVPEPRTVLAPSNAALQQLAELIEDCDQSNNADQIRSIVDFHIIDAEFTAADIADVDAVPTLGGEVPVNADGTIGSNDAQIVFADVAGSNGFVQVVDAVIQP